MGYFDALTSSAFKTTEDGRRLFFPWGVLGRGYVLSQSQYERLQKQVRIYTIVALALIIAMSALKEYLATAVVVAFRRVCAQLNAMKAPAVAVAPRKMIPAAADPDIGGQRPCQSSTTT